MESKHSCNKPYVTVGRADADIIGCDSRTLQAAVDYVGNLGGGVVEILPGRYTMIDSLHLRTGVTVRGHGDATVLVKSSGHSALLALDGDYGEQQIMLVDPKGFHPGMGVSIKDSRAKGCWQTTVAILTGQNGSTFTISRPLVMDYLVAANAEVTNAFPVISGRDIENAVIENLRVDGKKDTNYPISGCRGGGIYLYRASGIIVRGCIVHDFNGDGISYQKCDDVLIENCVITGNTNFGVHPGSGSSRPIVRSCEIKRNGAVGLFICWRVKNGIFENNVITDNGTTGISIGHKDTDNIIRGNLIANNGLHGIHFREELEPMAAHRNLIQDNKICDNGNEQEGYGIKIDSKVSGVVITENLIGTLEDRVSQKQKYGIYQTAAGCEVTIENNVFQGNSADDIYIAKS